ncbi:MAG: hypothetical protein C3F13_06630 [Anaerolineales bacterium]|nr:MAG: hypothetical protein C3F13_06630 [Anaerolineales bacterium]
MQVKFFSIFITASIPAMLIHDSRHTAASIMLDYGIPPIMVAGMLGHSLTIIMTTYAHLARFARDAPCVRNIPGTQDEAARLMDDILIPIPIEIRNW